jgi:hypothetical protein
MEPAYVGQDHDSSAGRVSSSGVESEDVRAIGCLKRRPLAVHGSAGEGRDGRPAVEVKAHMGDAISAVAIRALLRVLEMLSAVFATGFEGRISGLR